MPTRDSCTAAKGGEVDRLAVKTRPSDARPAFTCAAAAADFPFPVHPHMPTHACGVPSQNQQKTQPKLVIVFRRAIFDPQERAHRRPTPATVRSPTIARRT